MSKNSENPGSQRVKIWNCRDIFCFFAFFFCSQIFLKNKNQNKDWCKYSLKRKPKRFWKSQCCVVIITFITKKRCTEDVFLWMKISPERITHWTHTQYNMQVGSNTIDKILEHALVCLDNPFFSCPFDDTRFHLDLKIN